MNEILARYIDQRKSDIKGLDAAWSHLVNILGQAKLTSDKNSSMVFQSKRQPHFVERMKKNLYGVI